MIKMGRDKTIQKGCAEHNTSTQPLAIKGKIQLFFPQVIIWALIFR